MDEEVENLGAQLDRLIALVGRLADENSQLRTQLSESHSRNQQLQQRMLEARSRVEAALARLPAPAEASTVIAQPG
ncbi:MAG: hypothetical protein RLZZ153_2344 [Pseudomonadota bacterium]|jgi:uncharacterized protein (TIGR02449 family)